MTTTRSQSLAMSSPQAVPAPLQPESPESIPAQEESLSPEWVHAITNLLIHSITSGIGQKIKKWIFYQALFDYTNLVITWDPIEFEVNRNLQKYEDSNCNITHLQSNKVKQLTSLMNYMIHLIKQNRPADQRYHAYYFILDEQWFSLIVHDVRSILVNPVLEKPQVTDNTKNSHTRYHISFSFYEVPHLHLTGILQKEY